MSGPTSAEEEMMEYTLAADPFSIRTVVVAPAVLTNASSVLALGTNNRLARVADRNPRPKNFQQRAFMLFPVHFCLVIDT